MTPTDHTPPTPKDRAKALFRPYFSNATGEMATSIPSVSEVAEAIRAAEERGRSEEREATLRLFTSGEFCKMPDHPKKCLCPIVEEALRARSTSEGEESNG